MKTKSKVIVLLEIAIVLCSMFLVTLPATAIAAEEDDYVLGIYGNANEDDTIDMRDLTYVKLIFFGKKPETELADAKYDGKTNPLDFIQIKLIIVGKEKELTVVDSADRIVMVDMPVERIAFLNTNTAEIIRSLEMEDKVVGVVNSIPKKYAELFPVMKDAVNIGSHSNPDLEKIVEISPQVLIQYSTKTPKLEEKLESTEIKVIRLDFSTMEDYDCEFKILGFVLGNRDRMKEFFDWKYEYLSLIESRVEDLNAGETVQVYGAFVSGRGSMFHVTGQGSGTDAVITTAGGENIAADLPYMTEVDPEWILVRNPGAAILVGFTATGYHHTDYTAANDVREEFLNHPVLKETDAAKQGNVYVLNYYLTTNRANIGICYVAKWLYPELFEDIHPEEINREYFERFLRAEYKGTYAYPPPD